MGPRGPGSIWNRWSLTTPTGAAAGWLGKAMTGRRGLWNIWTKCNGFESSYSMGVSFAVIGWERLVGCGLRRRCCGVGSRGVGVLVEGTTAGGCDGVPEALKAQCSE